MADETGNQQSEEQHRSRNDLLLWFALLPFVLISLFCCGAVATLPLFSNPSANTRSLFAATYQPWPNTQMPPINMAAVVQDIYRETTTGTAPTFVIGTLIYLPTASDGTPRPVTTEPAGGTPSPTSTTALNTPAGQITPTRTATSQVMTNTPTHTPQVITATPSRTSTKAPPPPPPPTSTESPPEPPPATDTPEPPTPIPPTPTWTDTPTPTATWTFTPTATTPPPPPTPSYALIIPIPEQVGPNGTGGCRAYFGYLNSNPQPVTIDPAHNYLTNTTGQTFQGTPPTIFQISRVFGAFYVDWSGGGNMVWTLDTNSATAIWCNPPVIP